MGFTRTTGISIAAVAAMTASFVGGMAVAGGDGPGEVRRTIAGGTNPLLTPREPGGIRFVNSDLVAADSCTELLDWYVERGVEQVGAHGWDSPSYWYDMDLPTATSLSAQRGGAMDSAAAPVRATSSETGTNVQEAGVDEPDLVKTDGSLLVRVLDGDLVTYDVSRREPQRLATFDLPRAAETELLLVGDRVVVLSHYAGDGVDRPTTSTLVVDVSDPEQPDVVDEATYDTGLVTARQHGDTVRLVLDSALPDLDFVRPARWRSEKSALEHNRDVVRDSELADWLPTVTRNDADAEQLLGCGDVALPADDSGLGTLAVVGLDPATPDESSVSAVATASELAYFSTDRMYLATGQQQFVPCCWDGPDMAGPSDGTTHLYAFELAGTRATYTASGQVDGSIRDRWAMDEADGVLRVAVGPTQRTGNFNSVVTLEEDGDHLVEIGRLDKLGVNETIRSVRWSDGLAFVVTFRQVDPLYAVDLTDPSRPRTLGKLKIPGYSEYLHPLGRHRLIGMGQDASLRGMVRGARAALFNVTDLTRPRTLDTVDYRRGSQAGAAADPRQFTWLQEQRTALTVISQGGVGRTGWVSVLSVADGRMTNRMVEVEYGVEIDQVRTVPLPDGRVLLVTGEQVSDFPL